MFSKRRLIILTILFVFVVALFNLRQGRPIFYQPHEAFVDGVLTFFYQPIQKGLTICLDFVQGGVDKYFLLVNVKQENKELKQALQAEKLFSLSLQERLHFKVTEETIEAKLKSIGLDGIQAKVIGYDPFAASQTIWIDQGSKHGLKPNLPVMTTQGLVGRTWRVFESSSQVLLLVDTHFSVDVLDVETRARALVVGLGRKVELKRYPLLSHIEFLNIGEDLREGDLLITSGLGSIYPSGIPVGNIIEIPTSDDYMADFPILPIVDVTKLENVIILTKT